MLRQHPPLRTCLATHLALLLEYNLIDPWVLHRCLAVADGRCARGRWAEAAGVYSVMAAEGRSAGDDAGAVKRGRCLTQYQMDARVPWATLLQRHGADGTACLSGGGGTLHAP